MPAGTIYVAKDTFVAYREDGSHEVLHKGQDRVRAGHWIVEKYPDQFEELTVQYDVEQATAHPGEVRPFASRAAAAEAATDAEAEPGAEAAGAEPAPVGAETPPGPAEAEQPGEPAGGAAEVVRPPNSATKAEWVRHAVDDRGWAEADAEAATKAELQALLYPDEH